jgi:hypothetical protein
MDNNSLVEIRAICLGSKLIKSKKDGSSYYINQFLTEGEGDNVLDLIGKEPVNSKLISGFDLISDGKAFVGTLSFERSVFNRRPSLRLKSFA